MQKIALDPFWKNMLLGVSTMGTMGAGLGGLSGYLKRDLLGLNEEEDLLKNPYFHTLPEEKREKLLDSARRKESGRRIRSVVGNMLLGGLTAIPAGVAYGHLLHTGRNPIEEIFKKRTEVQA